MTSQTDSTASDICVTLIYVQQRVVSILTCVLFLPLLFTMTSWIKNNSFLFWYQSLVLVNTGLHPCEKQYLPWILQSPTSVCFLSHHRSRQRCPHDIWAPCICLFFIVVLACSLTWGEFCSSQRLSQLFLLLVLFVVVHALSHCEPQRSFLPRTTLITQAQVASSDPLLFLGFSQMISFYSDSREMGLDSPLHDYACTAWMVSSKVKFWLYCQSQGAWQGSTLDTVAMDLSQLHSILFLSLFESLDQFSGTLKVLSSWLKPIFTTDHLTFIVLHPCILWCFSPSPFPAKPWTHLSITSSPSPSFCLSQASKPSSNIPLGNVNTDYDQSE